MDRKDFFTSGLKDLGRKAYRTAPGRWLDQNLQGISNLLNPAWGFGLSAEASTEGSLESGKKPSPGLPRPPGALSGAGEFKKACTACGDCIVACPHGTLFSLPDHHGPLLDPNHIACHLCPDYPCIEACPEEALLPMGEALPGFGMATLQGEACLNSYRKKGGRKCKECEDRCPIEDVIEYDRQGLPQIADHCTGCGLCVESCPTGALSIVW